MTKNTGTSFKKSWDSGFVNPSLKETPSCLISNHLLEQHFNVCQGNGFARIDDRGTALPFMEQ